MKRLKDPLYGYIDIEDDVFDLIIDTPEFQRLRGVTQTSYAPLYASAVHNRFVHSLGVYHLGKIVANSIEERRQGEEWYLKKYLSVFKYACLLHDIGHAPFSHTGENFFLGSDGSRKSLHNVVVELTKDNSLSEEIFKRDYKAAPHELMSVVVSLRVFQSLFCDNEERSFFARCILGYPYVIDLDEHKSYLNCLIAMLNSSIIDVDKLDYLIRDAYITGYDTVSIDYHRLLKNINFILIDGTYKIVYHQAAISVIESVIFAHDSERKWIQNHPIVQYEAFLLQHAIEVLNSKYPLFTYDALSQVGVDIFDGYKVSLINDGDILFLMKNFRSDSLIQEYFFRKIRRHPLWKSEAEYKAIFNKAFTDNTYAVLEEKIEKLVKYLSTTNFSIELNQSAHVGLTEDIDATRKEYENASGNQKDNYKINLEEKEKHLKLLDCFKQFAEDQTIDFDFVILTAKRFNSGFGKVDFEKIEVDFSTLKSTCAFKKVANSLSAGKNEREKFFYVFYKRKDRKHKLDVAKLAQYLMSYVLEEVY